jgi:hypothetical protein
MTEKEIDIQDILKELRNIIGAQAQEIAVLKAAVSVLRASEADSSAEAK